MKSLLRLISSRTHTIQFSTEGFFMYLGEDGETLTDFVSVSLISFANDIVISNCYVFFHPRVNFFLVFIRA